MLNARQYSINPGTRPKDIENEYGGTIGGPIKIPACLDGQEKDLWIFQLHRIYAAGRRHSADR